MSDVRKVILECEIPSSKIDWLTKLLYNVCLNGAIHRYEISSEEEDMVVALTEQHVDAIANEAVTYLELEQKVRDILSQ